jgi:hypothetical protein
MFFLASIIKLFQFYESINFMHDRNDNVMILSTNKKIRNIKDYDSYRKPVIPVRFSLICQSFCAAF